MGRTERGCTSWGCREPGEGSTQRGGKADSKAQPWASAWLASRWALVGGGIRVKEVRKAEKPFRRSSSVITGWLRWEGASGAHLLQTPVQNKVSQSRLLRAMSIGALKCEIPSGHKKTRTRKLYWGEGGGGKERGREKAKKRKREEERKKTVLDEVSQRCCGVSAPEDVPNQPKRSPGQAASAGPVSR